MCAETSALGIAHRRSPYRGAMAYKPRVEIPYGYYYHVAARGNNKRPIYDDHRDRENFLVRAWTLGGSHPHGGVTTRYVSLYSGPDPPSGGVSRPPFAVMAPHWM